MRQNWRRLSLCQNLRWKAMKWDVPSAKRSRNTSPIVTNQLYLQAPKAAGWQWNQQNGSQISNRICSRNASKGWAAHSAKAANGVRGRLHMTRSLCCAQQTGMHRIDCGSTALLCRDCLEKERIYSWCALLCWRRHAPLATLLGWHPECGQFCNTLIMLQQHFLVVNLGRRSTCWFRLYRLRQVRGKNGTQVAILAS